MYYHEWSLFEESGDVFLLRAGAPLVFEVDLENSRQCTWPQLRAFLDRRLEGGRFPKREKPLPVKPTCYNVWELSERLLHSNALISWTNAEVGHMKEDNLPEAARLFLQQVDLPTFQAKEQREQLREHGLLIDGAWMPSTIGDIVTLLYQMGVPPSSDEAPWQFQARVTAKNGALLTLYEVTRPGCWGFALRGLEQQEVLRDLKAFLSYWKQATASL